jgi:hypothetical protein
MEQPRYKQKNDLNWAEGGNALLSKQQGRDTCMRLHRYDSMAGQNGKMRSVLISRWEIVVPAGFE